MSLPSASATGGHLPADADPNRTLQGLLDQRYSCRGFLPQEVPRATIERILQLAQRTASWCNAQPWQVVITRGAATERLRAALLAAQGEPPQSDFPWPREYQGVYQARRRECGLALYDAVGVPKGDREASARQALENFRFFGAPHVAIVTSDEALGVYGAVDCGAFVSNFMLAATSLGVATVPQAALASRADVLRAQLGLAADRRVVCGISFGFADEAHPANGFRTTRAGLDEVLTWAES
ncbi:nitroreductase [Pseudacidovorax intermedius]|uniref:Nitroreductase n=1 Tax=Pseudacidovorax intermedius TaxID=433924 RepID=A0A370FJH3_9BURK|nr:nitroreductase [Pseudacidovorax intermedius]RDI24367.1 nitroreductase [Pseudacidovorax intermedius]